MATGRTNLSAQMPDENRIYLFRLQILIVDGGLLVLRNILDQTLNANNVSLAAILHHELQKITRLKNRSIITQAQFDILYPAGGKVPSTLDMDITLIISLLRNIKCFGLNAKFDWSITPAGKDFSVEADILRLKKYRNDIFHVSTTTVIKQKMFTTWWKDIEKILIRLNSSVQKPVQDIRQVIDAYKKSPIDTEIEERILKEIKKWNDIEAYVYSLKEDVVEIKDDLKRLQDESSGVKSNKNIFQRLFQRRRYKKAKQALKDDLIDFYYTEYSRVPMSPLFEEKDTQLATFYIRPDMSPDRSLSDMFDIGSITNREIYLTADAGFGKTTFSKYLAISWCQAHRPEAENMTAFEKDDIECLHEFDFVFLVLLRDSFDLCSIDDLIFELIVSNLAHKKLFDTDFLEEILNREKCLVVLDGLDEWTHPDNQCHRTPRSIPHRNYRKSCTILTTTRPWKLGVLNLSSNKLGKEVALTKLNRDSVDTLTRRTIQRLKSLQSEHLLNDEIDRFNKEINARNNADLVFVPLLLMYIICLWCDDGEIGNSKCELYVNIVELLLSRTTRKYGELQTSQTPSPETIPHCFTGHEQCTKYFTLLITLGKLAYHTLFNTQKGITLVFDRSTAKTYLNDNDMKLSLLSGILTENTSKTLTKRISKLSFGHETIQEFFAAIFISFQSDGQNAVLEKCKTVDTILDMSTVCQFMSGLNATMMCKISEGFMYVINEDIKTCEYRTRTDYEKIYENQLYHIQNMLVSCLKEIPEIENAHLCIQDLFISGQSEQNLKRLSLLNKRNLKSLYIDLRMTSSSLSEIIELSSLTSLTYLQKLYYKGEREKETERNRLFSPSLESLRLYDGNWTNFEEDLSEKLNQIQNLQNLYIREFTFSHEILETILSFICNEKTLKNVTLSKLSCIKHGRRDCERLRLDLSGHSQLTTINVGWLSPLQLNITTTSLVYITLSCINLGETSILLSAEMVNIKRVELSSIEMSAESLQNNLKVLEILPQAVIVEMTRCDIEPETQRERLRNYIRRSDNFNVTNDKYKNRCLNFEFNTRRSSREKK